MNCRVCGNPLFAGRATFRCSCGAITHGYCWEKHVLASHEPEFSVGTVDLDGQYAVNEPEPRISLNLAARKRRRRCWKQGMRQRLKGSQRSRLRSRRRRRP